MILDVDTTADAGVVTNSVEAMGIQPWMLVWPDGGDDVFVVEQDPVPYLNTGQGWSERWVEIPVFPSDSVDPVHSPSRGTIVVVFGARPDTLRPMLPDDVYGNLNMVALARNGMCHERVDEVPEAGHEDDEWEGVVYCGRPSDVGSYYRYCAAHDEAAREESEDLQARGYEPTYGAFA